MLLDVTTKTNKDETQDSGILDLEYAIAKVSLHDNDDIKQSQVIANDEDEEEEATTNDLTTASEPSSTVEEDETESAEEKCFSHSKTEEETEKDVDLKVSLTEEKLSSCDEKKSDEEEEEESDSAQKEKSGKVDYDIQEEKEDKLSSVGENERSDDEKDAEDGRKKENYESENESAPSPVVKEKKKEKKLLPRGFGTGTSEQQYQHPIYQQRYDNINSVHSPADASQMAQALSPRQAMTPSYSGMPVSPMSGYAEPNMYGQLQALSPQQAMTPSYSGMPVSPMSGFTELNMYGQVQNGSFGCMSSVEGVDGISGIPYWNPDTPPYCARDENENFQVIPTPQPYANTPDEVLKAIKAVENNPDSSRVPAESLIAIKKLLFDQLDDSEMMQDPVFVNGPPPPYDEEEITDRNAETEIQRRIDISQFEKVRRRMALLTNEDLTKKDDDGDTPCVVVACQDENSERFNENLVAMVERSRPIKICCETPVPVVNAGETKKCVVCGNTNQNKFYSPFAMFNNSGDSLLSSVIRARHSQLVVIYICENIYGLESDMKRIFGGQNTEFYRTCQQVYPVLKLMLHINNLVW